MNILLINTYDNGGAAKACMRLHEGLLRQGISSRLLILFSKNEHPENGNIRVFGNEFPYVYKKPGLLKRAAIKAGMGKATEKVRKEIESLIPNSLEAFSEPYSAYDFTQHPWYKEADIVHLHWTSGFIDYSFFSKHNKPTVWTLHDMNAFTGGCHYSNGCDKFVQNCSTCPYLATTSNPAYTAKLLQYKKENVKKTSSLQIVSPSNWLANCSKKSPLFKPFKHSVIPYGIDTNVFKPYPEKEARKELGLPAEKKILLFVAEHIENKRKGSRFLIDAAETLGHNKDIVTCVVGKPWQDNSRANFISLGEINSEETLAKAYSAADVLLAPSLEDNLPNTALESILCGTPVIAFNVGGLPDIIEDGKNGYLAADVSTKSLADKINLFLEKGVQLSSAQIRDEAVAKYDMPISANRYINLYKDILST